jgi:glucose-1-phosphate adenylyltransferase
MATMANVLGLIFANIHEQTITDLTKIRAMGSVPFAARYRLIDFPLSNMANSGINEVGIITKANYQSLLDHLGSGTEWDLLRKNGGLKILPPYGHGSGLFRGRLDALAGVYSYIAHTHAEYVLLSDCDIVANMDFRDIIDFHETKNADITMVYGRKHFTAERLKSKTVVSVDKDGRVYDVLVNPNKEGEFDTSMNFFVMKKDFLLDIIKETESRNLYDFEVDVIQHKIKEYKVFAYKYEGYYEQIDSMLEYFKANLALMDTDVRAAVFSSARPIYTKIKDEAPAKYGIESSAKNTLVADGCVIDGNVENSILFRGVKVGKGAIIRNSIILPQTVIGEKCELNYVVADKDVRVGNFRSVFGTPSYPVFISKGATV